MSYVGNQTISDDAEALLLALVNLPADATKAIAKNGVTTLTQISVGGSGGVTSFNTRTGAVTLTSADVTTALGYTPGTITGTGTATRMAFWSGTSTISSDPAINWNNTSKYLVLGTGTSTFTASGASGGIVATQAAGNTFFVPYTGQNASAGTTASTDFILGSDNATDSTNYFDIGINSSTNADPLYTAMGAGAGYIYTQSGGLTIGTAAAQALSFITGGTLTANVRLTIRSTGQLTHATASIVSVPAFLFNGAVFTGGTATTTRPFMLFEPTGTTAATTWSTSGTQFGINAVSGFAGNFVDWKVNNATAFSVTSTGAVSCNAITSVAGTPSSFRQTVAGGTAGYDFIQFNNSSTSDTTTTGANLSYYLRQSFGGNTTVAAGKIQVIGETNWTSGANTNSVMQFHTTYAAVMSEKMRISAGGNITYTQAINTSGSPTMALWTAGASTGLTASTEAIDINFNLARTVQFATGAITTQRAFVVQAPTYAFVGASTITNAATVTITGAPVAGTNATITTPMALWVQAGLTHLAGGVRVDTSVYNDGGGIKHARVTTGSVSAGSTALVTITWTTAFADANYTVEASVVDSTTSSLSLSVVHVESITASAVTVRVLNNAIGSLTGTVHVMAMHD